jgi:hypothetical protein
MQVTGQLKVKSDTQIVSDKFKKREFVLTTEAKTPYPQHVSFQVTQDKCDILDKFSEGQEVEVSFNLRGREWNGPQGIKYFNTLEAWLIKAVGESHNNTQNSDKPVFINNPSDNGSDLPF